MIMRRLALILLVAAIAAALPALAHGGVVNRGPVPDGAALMGSPLCRHDTPGFRLWWAAAPGAPGAVGGADGSCALPPPVVAAAGDAAESARARAVALGFPAIVGDPAPPVLEDRRFTAALLRMRPAARARALGAYPARFRGRFLAGLAAAHRARMLRGMPRAVQRRLAAQRRAALRGRPADFIGGDRRVDIVVDGTGATGMVQDGQPGVAVCRTRGRARTFAGAWIVVLAGPDRPPASTTAHELMHVIQCNLAVRGDAPQLLREGAAEWFAAVADPASFPGAQTAPDRVVAGTARAASFCNGFDPLGSPLSAYSSWAVWEALDAGGARGGPVRRILDQYRRAAPDGPAGVIRRVGAATWSDAVRSAAAAVCADLRTPSGGALFPAALRDFLGAAQPATGTAPADVVVAPGGVTSVRAIWGYAPTGTVSVLVRGAGVPPEALAGAVVSSTGSGRLPARVRDGAAVVDVPADALGEGSVPLTIANPSSTAPLQARVEVVATAAG